MKNLGIYVHIPFCKQKCKYCDFVSFQGIEEIQNKYIECLLKEIQKQDWAKINSNYKISTIYIGGGTPSYLNSEKILEILKVLKKYIKNDLSKMEITIEINPGTVTESKLKDYKNSGINRLSIGLQSTNKELLKELGRIHNFEDFLNTYKLARKIGFKNINVDLMIGLPKQKIDDIKKSLEKLIELSPNHISVYSLILEEGTEMYELVQNKKIMLPSEELERQMYWYVKNKLELAGYKHYEISNFAKEGYESKHNISCWNQEEYLGFGLAAHSYFQDERFCNTSNLDLYLKNIEIGKMKKNVEVLEVQDTMDKKKEYMLLGLRKIEGISISKFKEKYIENPVYLFKNELSKLAEDDLIEIDMDNIRLTNKGLDFGNLVWEEFI